MDYTTFRGNEYSGGAIIKKGERILYCRITADLHTKNSAHTTVLEEIYTDALLSGAGQYSREQFIDAVNMLGASFSVSINNSKLSITLRATEENTPKLLKLFETVITQPAFEEAELDRIQKQLKNELLEHKEDAKSIAHENLENALYDSADRRYTYSPDTCIAEISSVTTTELRSLHARATQSFWTVTVGANQNTVKLVTKSVDRCKLGVRPLTLKRVHKQKPAQAKTILQNIPSKQNIEFSIGTILPFTLHHPEYLPFVFGLNVLGKWGGFTGRLMSIIREKEGLTYGIYAQTETVAGEEQGHWRIMTFFSPAQAVQGLTSTVREIHKIHKNGITQSEYDRFRVIIKTQQAMLADSLIRSVDSFHGYLCEDFSIEEMQHYKEKMTLVTRSEVNQSLKKYLSPETLVISGAGPTEKVKKDILAITQK